MSSEAEPNFAALIDGVRSARRITGRGRNSRVYLLEREDGSRLVGKVYFRHANDPRDRLAGEWLGLSLCRQAGLDVPAPVTRDPEAGLLVMEHVAGEPVDKAGVPEATAAADFLAGLDGLRDLPENGAVPRASEACFSLDEFAEVFGRRAAALEGCRAEGPEYEAMRELLSSMRQELGRRMSSAAEVLHEAGGELDPSARILSPSDFGFHNALRRTDGSICFLDFEYFGWDDPAKTLCDFLLHPAMELEPAAGKAFADRLRQGLDRGGFVKRALALHPLFVLKWCFIFLNEFVACDLARREFAGDDRAGERLSRQLQKARQALETIDDVHARFRLLLA